MYEHFEALGKEKKERILAAAMEEFARYGYKKTSAEQIAKAAGIAKGMIFHYFGSKLGLYEYLISYSQERLKLWFGGLDELMADQDYIEQYRRATKLKLQAYTQEPYIFDMFAMIYTKPENIDVSDKTRAIYAEIIEMQQKALTSIFSSRNTDMFRDDVDTDKAKKYISWLIEGYTQYIIGVIGDTPLSDLYLDPFWAECDEMLDDLKKILYKPEQE